MRLTGDSDLPLHTICHITYDAICSIPKWCHLTYDKTVIDKGV